MSCAAGFEDFGHFFLVFTAAIGLEQPAESFSTAFERPNFATVESNSEEGKAVSIPGGKTKKK